MKKTSIKSFFTAVIVTLIAMGLSAATVLTILHFSRPEDEMTVTILDIETYISEISELNTSVGVYCITDRTEKAKEIFGHKIPLTTSYVTYRYSGKVKAGINLSKIKTRTTDTYVSITVPDAEILSNELNNDSLKIFDEQTSIFNPYSFAEFNDCQAELKLAGEKQVIEEGLLIEAKENAISQLKSLLSDICESQNVELNIS